MYYPFDKLEQTSTYQNIKCVFFASTLQGFNINAKIKFDGEKNSLDVYVYTYIYIHFFIKKVCFNPEYITACLSNIPTLFLLFYFEAETKCK